MIIALIIAYFLGSIPFGLLLTRAAGLGDIRTIGSGNIGATNVMRTGNKKLGIATLLLDVCKGMIPVLIAKQFGVIAPALYLVAFAAVLGHVFSVWLKFKGGKGVATAIGVLFGLGAGPGILVCIVWLIAYFSTRFVSLASITAFWVLLIDPIINGNAEGTLFVFALAALITWTHRANIQRLRAGTEPRRGEKKS